MNKKVEIRYFDKAGHEIRDKSISEEAKIEQAYSACAMWPGRYKFFVKRIKKTWFGYGREKILWDLHHISTTFGSWMWPRWPSPKI